MSLTKDYLFEAQQENCIAWIRQQYGIDIDPDADEERWEELAAQYSAMLDDEEESAELQWLTRHSPSQLFDAFSAELTMASSLLFVDSNSTHAPTAYKLVYAHAVTLMESLIRSIIRKLVMSDQELLMRLAGGHKKIRCITVSLKDIAEKPKLVENIVLKVLTDLTLHNVSTINEVLGAMLGEHLKGLDLAGIGHICRKRHDIVQRNGRTFKGQSIELTQQEVHQAIETIRNFSVDLNIRIYNALKKQEATE